jgi:LmbE family N-acetylglucosaminyl deacetylase
MRTRSILPAFLACLFALTSVHGQESLPAIPDRQAEPVGLHQALVDLNSPWTVMCVAAHPDDEDGSTLIGLRRKYGVHTVSLFSTFGEGGQNAIGPELYEELGAIRVRETQEAAAVQGSEPYFLGLRDFGFSKSAEEAFRIWGHDEALRRMVLKIRQLRPDVIITNHDTVSGHGHHQATGRLVLEAFDAAADPTRFPEQLKIAGSWQVQRVFVRVNYEGGTGSGSAETAAQQAGQVVTIDPNERDPEDGKTFAEDALAALHKHATQGPWPASVRAGGVPVIRYRLARKYDLVFPVGARTFLDGLRLPEAVESRIAHPPAIDGLPLYNYINQPGRVFDAIAAWRKESGIGSVDPLLDEAEPHIALMNRRVQAALAAASGISVFLAAGERVEVPGTDESFSLIVNNKRDMKATVRAAFRGWNNGTILQQFTPLDPGATLNLSRVDHVPETASIGLPEARHLYDDRLFGKQVYALVYVKSGGEDFYIPAATHVYVGPAVEIAHISPTPLVLTPSTRGRVNTLTLRLINNQHTSFEGTLATGQAVDFEGLSNVSLAPNETKDITMSLKVPVRFVSDHPGDLAHKPITFSLTRRGSKQIVTQDSTPAVFADARVRPNLHIGYVRGSDDTLGSALNALGVESKELTVEDVRTAKLEAYDTIVIDNRGYQVHPELIALNGRLLDYLKAGGTLIVCYHKSNEWNPDPSNNRPQLAPYPIILGNLRVTDEDSPVTFDPRNPLLNQPNQITQEDFKGWVQERGLYYPRTWDSHYMAPLATHDPGEQPLEGGLLAAEFGRGRYIYTSMVWYRQLRAGVPGAYRIFANLISYSGRGSGSLSGTH